MRVYDSYTNTFYDNDKKQDVIASDKTITRDLGERIPSENTIMEIDFIQPKKTVGKLISIDVFDKMKDEFISRYPKNYAGGLQMDGDSCRFSLNTVLQIIDKYKEESE